MEDNSAQRAELKPATLAGKKGRRQFKVEARFVKWIAELLHDI